jgi:hypothetical protein
MSQNLKANSTQSLAGAGLFTFTAKDAGLHYISANITDVPPSGIIMLISHNSNVIAQTPLFPSNAQSIFVEAFAECAIGDTLILIISPYTTNDSLPNTLKTLVRVERRS